MATLAVQTIGEAGLEAIYTAAGAGGDQFPNDGKTFVHIKNGDVGPVTVTATAQRQPASLSGYGTVTKGNAAIVVDAGEERFAGPFPPTAFNNTNGRVALTYSGVTSLTVAVLKLA